MKNLNISNRTDTRDRILNLENFLFKINLHYIPYFVTLKCLKNFGWQRVNIRRALDRFIS